MDDSTYVIQVANGDNHLLDLGIYKSGHLKFVSNRVGEYEQKIFYTEITGIIQSKLKIDSNNQIFGRAYYFYEDSGNLAGDFNYSNGLRNGSAVSYHDSSDHIKEVMLYNEKGQLYYRKTFDWQGNHVKTEGAK